MVFCCWGGFEGERLIGVGAVMCVLCMWEFGVCGMVGGVFVPKVSVAFGWVCPGVGVGSMVLFCALVSVVGVAWWGGVRCVFSSVWGGSGALIAVCVSRS